MTKTQKRLGKLVAKKLKMDEQTAAALAISPHALNPQFWENRAEEVVALQYDLDEAVRAVAAEEESDRRVQWEREAGLRRQLAVYP